MLFPCYLLKAKYDDSRVVIWPLAHRQVKVAVDFHPCKQTHVMDLKCETKKTLITHTQYESVFLHLSPGGHGSYMVKRVFLHIYFPSME